MKTTGESYLDSKNILRPPANAAWHRWVFDCHGFVGSCSKDRGFFCKKEFVQVFALLRTPVTNCVSMQGMSLDPVCLCVCVWAVWLILSKLHHMAHGLSGKAGHRFVGDLFGSPGVQQMRFFSLTIKWKKWRKNGVRIRSGFAACRIDVHSTS
jgi:hypothetical protein